MGLFGALLNIGLAPVRVARDVVRIPVKTAIDVIGGDFAEAAKDVIRTPVTVTESVIDSVKKVGENL